MLTQHLFYIGEDSDVTSNDNRNDEHVNAMVDVNFQNRFSSLPRLKKPRHVFYNDMSEENNNIKRGRRTYGGRDVRHSYNYNDNNDKNENKNLENKQRLKVDPSCLFFGTDTKKTDLAESFTNVHKSIGLDASSKYSITASISGNDSITSSLSAIDTTKTDLKVKHSTSDSQKYVGLKSSEDNLPTVLNTARGDDLDRAELVLETESIPLQTKNIENVNQNSQSQLNVVKSHAECFGNVMIQNEDTMNVNSTFSVNNLLTVDSHPVKMAGGTDIIENNTCSNMPSSDQRINDNNISSVNFNGINDISQVTSCGNKHKSIHTKDRITTKRMDESKMEGDTSLLTISKGNMSFYCPAKQINSTSVYDKKNNSDDAKKVCLKPAHDISKNDILSGQEISATHDNLVGCNILSGNLFVEKSSSNGCTVNSSSLYDNKNNDSDDAKKVCLKPAHEETLCGEDISEEKHVKGVTDCDHGLVESDSLSGQEISATQDNLKETLKGTIEKRLNARLVDGHNSKGNSCGEFFTDDILAGNLFVENSFDGNNLKFVEKQVNEVTDYVLVGDVLAESDISTEQAISADYDNLVGCNTLNGNKENDLNAGLILNETNFDKSFTNDISSGNLLVEKSGSIGFTGDNLKFGLVDPCVDNNNNISNRTQVDNVPVSVLSTENNSENTKSDCSLNSVIFTQSDISTRHYANNHEAVKNDKLFNDDANSVLKNDRNAINEVFNNLTSGSYGFLSKANELIEKLELPSQGGSTEELLDENSNIVSDDPGLSLSESQNIWELIRTENELESTLDGNLQNGISQNDIGFNRLTLNASQNSTELTKKENEVDSSLEDNLQDSNLQNVNLQNDYILQNNIPNIETDKQEIQNNDISTLQKDIPNISQTDVNLDINPDAIKQRADISQNGHVESSTIIECKTGKQKYHIELEKTKSIKGEEELTVDENNSSGDEKVDLLSKPCAIQDTELPNDIKDIIVQDEDVISEQDEISSVHINDTCKEQTDLFREIDLSEPCSVSSQFEEEVIIIVQNEDLINKQEEVPIINTTCIEEANLFQERSTSKPCPVQEYKSDEKDIQTESESELENTQKDTSSPKKLAIDSNLEINNLNPNFETDCLQNFISPTINNQVNINNRVNTDSVPCNDNNVSLYTSNLLNDKNNKLQNTTSDALNSQLNLDSEVCQTVGNSRQEFNKYIEHDIPGTLVDSFNTTSDTTCDTRNDEEENGNEDVKANGGNLLVDENKRGEKDIPNTLFDRFDATCCNTKNDKDENEEEDEDGVGVDEDERTNSNFLIDENEREGCITEMAEVDMTKNETIEVLAVHFQTKVEDDNLTDKTSESENYFDENNKEMTEVTCKETNSINKELETDIILKSEKEQLKNHLHKEEEYNDASKEKKNNDTINTNTEITNNSKNTLKKRKEEESQDPSIQLNGSLDTGLMFGNEEAKQDPSIQSNCNLDTGKEIEKQDPSIQLNGNLDTGSMFGILNEGEDQLFGKTVADCKINIHDETSNQEIDVIDCEVELTNNEIISCSTVGKVDHTDLNVGCEQDGLANNIDETGIEIDGKLENEIKIEGNHIDAKIADSAVARNTKKNMNNFNGDTNEEELKNDNLLNGRDTLSPCLQNGRDNGFNGMKPIEESCSIELISNQEQEPGADEVNNIKLIDEPCTFELIPNQEQTPEADASGSDSESLGSEFDIQDHIDKSKSKRSERESRIRSAFSFVLGLLSDSDDEVDVPVHDKLNKYTRHATPDGKKRNGSFKEDLLRGSVKFLSSDSSVDEDDVIIPLKGKPSKEDVNSIIPVNGRQSLSKNGSIVPEKSRLLRDNVDLAISVNGPPIKNEAVVPVLKDCHLLQDDNLLQSMDEIIAFSSPISSPFVLEKNENNFNLTEDCINLQLEDSTSSTITDNNIINEEDHESTIVSDQEGTERNNSEITTNEITLTENVKIELTNGTLLDEVDLGAKVKPYSSNINEELDTIDSNPDMSLIPTENLLTEDQITISSTLDLNPLEDNCMNNEEPMNPLLIDIEPKNELFPINTVNTHSVPNEEPLLVPVTISPKETRGQGLINEEQNVKNELNEEPSDILVSSIDTRNMDSVLNEESVIVPVRCNIERDLEIIGNEQNEKSEIGPNEEELFDKTDITVLEPDYDYDYYEPSSAEELDSSAQMKELNISFQKKIDSNVDIVDNDKVIIEIISLLIDQVDDIFKSVNNEKVAFRDSSFTEKELVIDDVLSNESDLSYPEIGFDIHDNNVNGSIPDDEKVPTKSNTFPVTYADICKGKSKMDIGTNKDVNEKVDNDHKKGINKESVITDNYKEQLIKIDNNKGFTLGEELQENTCSNTIDANINEFKYINTQVQENIIEPLISVEVKSDNPTNFEKLISLQKDDNIVSKCITNTTDLIIVDNNNDIAGILNVSPMINVDVKPQVSITTNNTKRRKSKGDVGKVHPQCANDYQLIAFGHDDTRVENNLSLFIKENDFLTDDEALTSEKNIIMSISNDNIKNINGDSEIENEEKLDDKKDEKIKNILDRNEALSEDKQLDGIITTSPADIIEVINLTLKEVSITDAKINDDTNVSPTECKNKISIKEEEELTTNSNLNENSHHTYFNIQGSNTKNMTSTDINSSCLLKGDVFNPNNSETEQKIDVCRDDNMTKCTRNVGDIEQENITCDDIPIQESNVSNNEDCVNLNVSHTLSNDLLENVANLDIKHILTSNSLENTQDNGGINQNSVVITNLDSNSCEKSSNVENTTCVDKPTIDFDNIPVISTEQTKNQSHVDLGYKTALISDIPLSVQGNYDNCDVVTNLDDSNLCNSNEEDSHSIIVKEEVFTFEDENKVEMEIQMEDLFEENSVTQVIGPIDSDLTHTKGKVLDLDQSSDKVITIENKDKVEIETSGPPSQAASEIGKNIVIRRKSDQLISIDDTDGYCDISIKETKNDTLNVVYNSEITDTLDILVPETKPNEFPEKSTDSCKNIKSFDSFDILDDFVASSPTLVQRNSSLIENDNTASDIENDSFELYGYSSEILDIATSLIDDSNLLIVEESFTSIDNKTKNTLDSINDVSNLLDDSTLLIDDSADLLDDASALMDGTKSLISDSTASVDDLLASISQMKPSRDFTNNNPNLTVISEKDTIHTDVVLNNDQTNPSLISDITTLINNTTTLLSDFHSLSDDFVQTGVIESNTDISNVLDKQERDVTILENVSSQKDELLKDNLYNDKNENIHNIKDRKECLTKKESSIDKDSKANKLLQNETVGTNEKQVSPFVELENPYDTLQTLNSEEVFTTPCEKLQNTLDITTNSSLNEDQPNMEINLPNKELVHPNMEIDLPNKDLILPNMEPETPFEIVENPYKEFETPNKDFHISYKLTTPNPSITDNLTSNSDTLTSVSDTTKLDSDSSSDSEEEKEGYQTVLDRFNALIGSRK